MLFFFFFQVDTGTFPNKPPCSGCPLSFSKLGDRDSPAELYLTHLEPSRRAHKVCRRCSPLTVSHVPSVKFLVPRPLHLSSISFIYAARATVTRGNPHLTYFTDCFTLLTERPPPFQPSGNRNFSRDQLVSTSAPASPGLKPHPPRSSRRNPRLHARPGAGGRMPRPHPRPCRAVSSRLLQADCSLRKWRTRYNQLLRWLSPRKEGREGKHGAEPGRWLEGSGGRAGLGPDPDWLVELKRGLGELAAQRGGREETLFRLLSWAGSAASAVAEAGWGRGEAKSGGGVGSVSWYFGRGLRVPTLLRT